MTTPNTQTFSSLVSNFASTVQGRASQLINFTIGSVLRAIGEAVAGVALWLQGMVLQALALTRVSTCSATDVDSWLAQFGFSRILAVAAGGSVTFSRMTATSGATIPVGVLVQTSDGSQQFQVVADATNPAYNSSTNTYTVAAGVSSLTVKAVAVNAGAAGNVAANTVTVLAQSIPFIDTVTNTTAMTGGVDQELDAAVLARFQLWVNSLSRGTKAAIGAAILGVQSNLAFSIFPNVNYAGTAQANYFYVIVDDGTGNPPSSLLTAVTNAINAVIVLTDNFNVYAPVIVNATVAMTIVTAQGYVHSQVAAQVQAAIQAYINTLPIGAALPYAKLTQLAYNASLGVANVTGVTLNGGTADLTVTSQQVIKYATVTVN